MIIAFSECEELVHHQADLEVELEELRQSRHAAERQAEMASIREQNALMVSCRSGLWTSIKIDCLVLIIIVGSFSAGSRRIEINGRRERSLEGSEKCS